jgi:hypothetical protein
MGRHSFWTAEKVALLGVQPDTEVANRFGVSRRAVAMQRYLRDIPVQGHNQRDHSKWGETELALLRSYTDKEIAKMTGRSVKDVAAKRRSV